MKFEYSVLSNILWARLALLLGNVFLSVYEVFKNVADKYDLMNDVMSAGIHRLWKDELIRHLAPHGGMKLLDMAGGTGKLSFSNWSMVICDAP